MEKNKKVYGGLEDPLKNKNSKNQVELCCIQCKKIFYNRKGYYDYMKKNNRKIKFCSLKCCWKWQSINMTGKNNPSYGKKRPKLGLFNKTRIGIPISNEAKEKQRKKLIQYWKSEEGFIQKEKSRIINRQWIEDHPKEHLERSKKGYISCPKISSIEIKIKQYLDLLKIDYAQQFSYELGIADFLITPKLILFVDGDFWHGNEKRFQVLSDKQRAQKIKDIIQTNHLILKGYNVLRLWETEIKSMDLEEFKNRLEKAICKEYIIQPIKQMGAIIK